MSGPVDLAFPGEPDYRDSPLLDAIRQGSSAAHGRLRDSWSVASDKALLQAAADFLPEVARGRPEEVPDALRWARRVGVITAITSMGVILTPGGLCLMATVTGSYDGQTFVSQDVPLMVAAGGPLVEYLGSTMHPRHLDLARRVISGCAPFDTLRLRKRLARILKVDDALAESASAPQVHHSTANAAIRPIAPFLSPGCQADWGRLGAKDQVRILWAVPKRPTEVLPHISGTGNELWAGLMVWASRQVGGASAGVPVTPLPKGLPEIRDWPLDVLRGAFEASTLPITTVEALGELLGDITPSWASAPVLALLASRGTEAHLSAASWTRVSSRTGGGAAAADLPVPAGAGASPVVDADAAGDDDPTQPYVNVDGVDPTVSDPWRLLEPCAGATTGAAPSAGGDAVPRGAHTPEGESPSNPTGVSREIKFGGTSIYEFDAESPIGEHVEDSPTPPAIPGPAGSGLGGGSVPADRHTTHAVDSRRAPSDGGCALVAAHRAAQSGFPPPISSISEILAGGSAGGSHASPVLATPQAPAPGRAGVHVSLASYAHLAPRRACPTGTAYPTGARVNVGTRSLRGQGVAPPSTRDAVPLCGSPVSRTWSVTWKTPRPRARPCPPSRIVACRSCSGSVRTCIAPRGSWLPCGVTTPRSAGDWCGSVPARGPSRRRAVASADSSPTPSGRHAMSRGRWTSASAGTSPPSSRLCRLFGTSTSHSPQWSGRCGAGCPRGTGRPPRRTRISGRSVRPWSAQRSCVWTPPPSLEQLSRRLRVPVQPVLHFPTEAVGQGPLLGLSADTRPMGRAPTPHEGPETSPAVRSAGKPVVAVTPGNRSGGDTTPTAADTAGAATPTPGRHELRALLVYLNEVPPDSQTGEAQKLHLHLATRLDLPPEFPQSNLRAQYTALGRLLPTRPELGQLVGEFVRDRRAEPSGSQTSALDSQGAAKVAAASRANQAGGNGKSPGRGKGGSDYDTYSVAVMVRWRVNPRDTPEAIYPLSPGRLGMVLKKAFGDFRVSYIKDEGQLCHTEDGGWALVGVRPEAASALEGGGGDADKQFTYEWAKANKQPYSGGLLRAHHVEKSNAVLQRMRSGDLMAGPKGLIRARDRDGAGNEGRKWRRSPSWSPPRASHRSEGDYTPRRGSRYPSPEDDYRRGGSRHTPQSVGGPWDGRYDYRAPSRSEQPR